MRHLLPVIALMTIGSCDKVPEKTSAQLKDELQLAAQTAKESALKSDAPAAREAAGRAAAALEQLRKSHEATTESGPTPEQTAFLTECEALARMAGTWATTASEKEARDEKLAGENALRHRVHHLQNLFPWASARSGTSCVREFDGSASIGARRGKISG